jgi:hypothetical protein
MAVDQATVERHAYLEFVEAFLDLGERKRYAATYLRLVRGPIRNAFDLLAELDLRAATRFLQQSVVLYVALAVTSVLASDGMGGEQSGILDDLAITLSLLVSSSIELAIFYALAKRSRTHDRSFREFLTFAALTLGFSLPLVAVGVQLMLTADTTLFLAGIGAWIFVLAYTVRVWQRFWGLSAKRAAAYLVIAAVVSSFVPIIGG